mmetsp:Transcript_69946/g.167907  ORF Transcript_69946/g.167907 Transcript_69946/m.167907 type:complete len:442 (+) Transcript_69946:36-1361(+)
MPIPEDDGLKPRRGGQPSNLRSPYEVDHPRRKAHSQSRVVLPPINAPGGRGGAKSSSQLPQEDRAKRKPHPLLDPLTQKQDVVHGDVPLQSHSPHTSQLHATGASAQASFSSEAIKQAAAASLAKPPFRPSGQAHSALRTLPPLAASPLPVPGGAQVAAAPGREARHSHSRSHSSSKHRAGEAAVPSAEAPFATSRHKGRPLPPLAKRPVPGSPQGGPAARSPPHAAATLAAQAAVVAPDGQSRTSRPSSVHAAATRQERQKERSAAVAEAPSISIRSVSEPPVRATAVEVETKARVTAKFQDAFQEEIDRGMDPSGAAALAIRRFAAAQAASKKEHSSPPGDAQEGDKEGSATAAAQSAPDEGGGPPSGRTEEPQQCETNGATEAASKQLLQYNDSPLRPRPNDTNDGQSASASSCLTPTSAAASPLLTHSQGTRPLVQS